VPQVGTWTFGTTEVVEWENMCQIFDLKPLSEGPHEVAWALEAWNGYSTGLLYLRLSKGVAVTHFKEVWRAGVPPKIKVFLWQLI
jgi:hypothetical protein